MLKDAESVKIRNAQGFIDSENPFQVALDSDIQIGAVEIKDSETDTRLNVNEEGTVSKLQIQDNNQEELLLDILNELKNLTYKWLS